MLDIHAISGFEFNACDLLISGIKRDAGVKIPAMCCRSMEAYLIDATVSCLSHHFSFTVSGPLRNTQPFDIFGLPSISIPCGFSRDKLPIGLEISGPRLGESVVLALARAYEGVTDWHKRAPAI